ncbi:flavodoxin domain-containing protein [Corynebacterium jeddahense]|uniref:Flavodoxin domain protein n=1 Tax=Corynebacterium jeddahense TaxID=1414719 RepID=A0ABY7UP28_9CORY|nr:flavodoxin domain-containing protein [Corynebacterium jeddahense]WCZ39931.1 Flavodoxin domain protein [Corynebacterium jeddahense]
MACSIYYDTVYGSTREYAEALGERLGVSVSGLEHPEQVEADGPVVVLSPIHGPNHTGVKFVRSLPEAVVKQWPVALVTVGMSLDDYAVQTDAAAGLLGERAERVTRFYVPGRLNYSELSSAHSAVMKGIVGALRLKPRKSDNERAMIDAYGKDTDRVDLNRLDVVEEWVRQRSV